MYQLIFPDWTVLWQDSLQATGNPVSALLLRICATTMPFHAPTACNGLPFLTSKYAQDAGYHEAWPSGGFPSKSHEVPAW
jgi:hypothetical protein